MATLYNYYNTHLYPLPHQPQKFQIGPIYVKKIQIFISFNIKTKRVQNEKQMNHCPTHYNKTVIGNGLNLKVLTPEHSSNYFYCSFLKDHIFYLKTFITLKWFYIFFQLKMLSHSKSNPDLMIDVFSFEIQIVELIRH